MSKYDKYKESAFTHEEMQPMIIETDMTDVFDDLAKAFKAGHDAGRSEAADEIERLREIVKYYACDCDGHCDRTHDDCLINHAALREKQ